MDSFLTTAKTPYSIRNKMKKELSNLVQNTETDSEFSDSENEYKPSNVMSSKNDSPDKLQDFSKKSNISSNNNEIELELKTKKFQSTKNNFKSKPGRKSMTYSMKTEEYFASHASSKIGTSDHTLQKLKIPKLSEDELQALLTATSLNDVCCHDYSIQKLYNSSNKEFQEWMILLNEGFSILIYGLGSKRHILSQFQKEISTAKYPVIVINGYFPSLTVKDIIEGIITDILGHVYNFSNIYDGLNIIKEDFTYLPNLHLYLFIHNIDGDTLRSNKCQNILAYLAAIPNIHLIASLDHINTPMVWNHSALIKFNFIWWDATSFLPYTDETSFESSLLVQRSGALILSSINSVYQSLTKNSKGIFILILKYQLSKKDEKHYQGMPLKVLYSQCRESFLVSSDLALRTQLTEFLDHKLLKLKRSSDGTELLIIPIHNSVLQQCLEEISDC